MRRQLTWTTILWAFGGCVTGVKPPDPTPLVPIAGGLFLFGSTETCFNIGETPIQCKDAEQNRDPAGLKKAWPTVLVNLPPFEIEEHEVTNFQYRYCVEMGACTEPKITGTTGVEDYYGNPDFDDYPVFGVTQEQARQYCEFLGRRLPTEVEWERAAAGLAGEEANKRRSAIQNGAKPLEKCPAESLNVAMLACTGVQRPNPVKGSADDWVLEGDGKIWDLTGNVSEWVDNRWRENLTCRDALPESCDCFACLTAACKEDCYTQCPACESAGDACFTQCSAAVFAPRGLPRCIQYQGEQSPDVLRVTSGTEVAVRGGNFLTNKNNICRARTVDRSQKWSLDQVRPDVGFRCAADAAP